MNEKNKKLRKPKILIFLNDSFIKDLYAKVFSKAGFEVKTFSDYLNVVDLVAKEKPDILFCDILMRSMNGYQAIELLKKDNHTKNIPIIIVSNLFQKEDIEKGLSLGAIGYYCLADHAPIEITEIFKNHLIKTGKFTEKDFKKIEEKKSFTETEKFTKEDFKKIEKKEDFKKQFKIYIFPIVLIILFSIIMGFLITGISEIKISELDENIMQKTAKTVFIIICLGLLVLAERINKQKKEIAKVKPKTICLISIIIGCFFGIFSGIFFSFTKSNALLNNIFGCLFIFPLLISGGIGIYLLLKTILKTFYNTMKKQTKTTFVKTIFFIFLFIAICSITENGVFAISLFILILSAISLIKNYYKDKN